MNNVVYQRADHITERITFTSIYTFLFQHAFYQLIKMQLNNKEVQIILTIEAI